MFWGTQSGKERKKSRKEQNRGPRAIGRFQSTFPTLLYFYLLK